MYNIEETNEGPYRSKRLAYSLQSNLGYEYETNMFSSLPIQSVSLLVNYDPHIQQMSCHAISKSYHARQSYELDITGFYCTVKILKIGTPEIITIIVQQLEQLDFTVQYCV